MAAGGSSPGREQLCSRDSNAVVWECALSTSSTKLTQGAGVDSARQWIYVCVLTGGAGHKSSEERGDELLLAKGFSPSGERIGYPVSGILADSRDRASVELRRAVFAREGITVQKDFM